MASVEVEKEAIHLYMPKLRNTSLTIQGLFREMGVHTPSGRGKAATPVMLSLQLVAMSL